MNEHRLIDAKNLMKTIKQHNYLLSTRLNSTDYGMFTIGIQQAVDEQPTIDPETLPIVRKLRVKIFMLETNIDALRQELERVTAERESVVNRLHGYCSECKNYTEYHGQGPCATCCHEHFLAALHTENDNWEWKGV